MSSSLAPPLNPRDLILAIRGQRVILDSNLAALYGVETRTLNQAVKRNRDRFPQEFMFQLTRHEAALLRSQIVILKKRGHFRFLPHAFTEHGALMAANVLNSSRAVKMSVALVQEFVRLRRMTLSVETLSRKVNELEKGFQHHGRKFEAVFDAIRKLMTPPDPPQRRIGFNADK